MSCISIWFLSYLMVNKIGFNYAVGIDRTSDVYSGSGIVNYHYQVEAVVGEYIVTFKNYYKAATRRKYLEAAFRKLNITEWMLVNRSSLAALYPSDFDIVHIANAKIVSNIQHLDAVHPAIKGVTLQQSVQRQIFYVSESQSNTSEHLVQRNYNRRLLRVLSNELTDALKTNLLWSRGITGEGIRVGIFDTGLARNHPHFRNVKERTNWTNEKILDDSVSHGTFVAGVIASSKECLGFAPNAELHIFRVFTNTQVSYTSWFLDAFNYAMFRKIHILNLSIGGPDFLDRPFVDKVLELSANKVIMVSAIGNDGPLYGTLNNPGDQSDVIGVGGINSEDRVAKFSSRGMTTWEISYGYGRLKPDIVAPGSKVKGSNVNGGCRSLSGTSVASPVVTGALALILSGALNKSRDLNPASVKQILLQGSTRLPHNNMFEQGNGKLNILKTMDALLAYTPKVSLSPPYLDYREPYMWPYSSQPLFCGGIPSIINVTILNGVAVTGRIVTEPIWHPYLDKNGSTLDVQIRFSSIIWPWSGWMSVHINIRNSACSFEGIAQGHISLQILMEPFATSETLSHTVYFPIAVKIIPKPPRHKRILWDQYHNLRYPPGYIPRDNLKTKSDPLDWRGDHVHTNFRDMYQHLRNHGYYVDILRQPFTCFNASDYGTLLIADPEEEFFKEEIFKLQKDVFDFGLGVIIFADWYNTSVMRKITFFDENTRQWWVPDTGGANIPALNDLLHGFGISLSDFVAEGHYNLGEHSMHYASGTTLANFPKHNDNILIAAYLNDQGAEMIFNEKSTALTKTLQPIIGLFQMHDTDKKSIQLADELDYEDYREDIEKKAKTHHDKTIENNPVLNKRVLLHNKSRDVRDINRARINLASKQHIRWMPKMSKNLQTTATNIGRIAIMGDSNCIDSTHAEKPCLWLLNAFLEFTMYAHKATLLQKLNRMGQYQQSHSEKNITLPKRLANSKLHVYSQVIDGDNKSKKRYLTKCENKRLANSQPIYSWDHILKTDNKHLEDTNEYMVNRLKDINEELQLDQDFISVTVIVCIVAICIVLTYLKISRFKKF